MQIELKESEITLLKVAHLSIADNYEMCRKIWEAFHLGRSHAILVNKEKDVDKRFNSLKEDLNKGKKDADNN